MFLQFIHQSCKMVVSVDVSRHEKSFGIGCVYRVRVVDGFKLRIDCVTSHALDDGLACTGIPFGGF